MALARSEWSAITQEHSESSSCARVRVPSRQAAATGPRRRLGGSSSGPGRPCCGESVRPRGSGRRGGFGRPDDLVRSRWCSLTGWSWWPPGASDVCPVRGESASPNTPPVGVIAENDHRTVVSGVAVGGSLGVATKCCGKGAAHEDPQLEPCVGRHRRLHRPAIRLAPVPVRCSESRCWSASVHDCEPRICWTPGRTQARRGAVGSAMGEGPQPRRELERPERSRYGCARRQVRAERPAGKTFPAAAARTCCSPVPGWSVPGCSRGKS